MAFTLSTSPDYADMVYFYCLNSIYILCQFYLPRGEGLLKRRLDKDVTSSNVLRSRVMVGMETTPCSGC